MNVQDLIEELKKMSPLQPVKLLIRGGGFDDELGGSFDAECELQDVSFQGNHIRLEGE